jgi:hypothetical protein
VGLGVALGLFERLMRPLPASIATEVGQVGNEKDAFAAVGCAYLTVCVHTPSKTIAQRGQVGNDALEERARRFVGGVTGE